MDKSVNIRKIDFWVPFKYQNFLKMLILVRRETPASSVIVYIRSF